VTETNPADIPQAVKDEAKRQLDLLRRGAVQVYTDEELLRKLARAIIEKRSLRIKLGMDPTAPDIHLGHTVVMGKMRQFQDLGHKAVLIIGDYTARIGDPTGANHTRPVLSDEQIEKNARTYFEQAGKVLDTNPDRLELRHNSEWLAKLTFADVLKLAAKMTVARMLERDTFEKRHRAGDPIGVHEFLYPLMQAYDSVVIRADVELGGTDQTFNCLAGRDLMRDAGLEPQIVLTMPLLVGLDGVEKMSKSKGNYVGITDAPNEMFGKLMSIPDALMENYFTLLTAVPVQEIQQTLSSMHPREAKERLAVAILTRYYGQDAAMAAAAEFRRIFSDKEKPSEIPEVAVKTSDLAGGKIGLARLIVLAGFATSNSEAMRLVTQGGVSIDDEVITDPKTQVAVTAGAILRVGKRRWGRLALK
jgi:tyrosyl-tRNA synthetase